VILKAETPEQRVFLVSYVAKRTGIEPFDLVGPYWFEALAAVERNKIVGAVIYTNHRHPSVETHWAGDVGWLTRQNLKGIFSYPFHELGVKRVTGIIRKRNKRARAIAERIGFRLEGVHENGFEDCAACSYGLTPNRCRWITL
jgi:RimJ/RimL family protein N-acetyltransferase